MAQTQPHSYFLDLASKYLSANATDTEIKELENWVAADAENRKTFMAFKKAWMLTGALSETSTVDVDALWEKTAGQVFNEAKTVKLKARPRRRWLTVAASLVLLLSVGAALFFGPWNNQVLTASTGTIPERIEMEDGSAVILNRSSNLAYEISEKAPVRRIELQGDAFFDVARDTSKPFIVRCRSLEVEVLGTSFYIDAREAQEEIQVVVESGRVAVRHQSTERVLEAGEMAIFSEKTSQIDTLKPADENYKALKTNTLTFESAKLSDVIFEINRFYHSDIILESEALKDCEFSSVFKDKSLDTVIKVLEFTYDLTVTRKGATILLSGDCNTSE